MRHESALLLLSSLTLSLVELQAASADAQAPPAPVAVGHRILQHEVGDWDAVVRNWATPDAQPAVSRGTETNRMLGQMWVVGVFEIGSDGTSYR
ncbi:MAG: DUF1579 family protein, partial [Bythopirellula sp.]